MTESNEKKIRDLRRCRKAAATKKKRRLIKKCVCCQKEYSVKPSHYWRKFCSNACSGQSKRSVCMRACGMCGRQFKVRNSDPKKYCSVKCAGKAHGEWMKETGFSPMNFRNRSVWESAMKDPARGRKISEKNTGKQHGGRGMRFGCDHPKLETRFVRSPANVVYMVRNMRKFVAEHLELFDPADVIWRRLPSGLPSGCRAADGLCSLFRRKHTRLSWKGWTAVSVREGRENGDLINRKPMPEDLQSQY